MDISQRDEMANKILSGFSWTSRAGGNAESFVEDCVVEIFDLGHASRNAEVNALRDVVKNYRAKLAEQRGEIRGLKSEITRLSSEKKALQAVVKLQKQKMGLVTTALDGGLPA